MDSESGGRGALRLISPAIIVGIRHILTEVTTEHVRYNDVLQIMDV